MLVNQDWGYGASCDFCSYSEDFDEAETFQDAVDAIKKDGWLIAKDGDSWTHKCPHCRAKK